MITKIFSIKKQKGFTLIETMISMSILLIGISGTLGLFTIGFRNLVKPKRLTTAMNIARQKMEEIKNTPFEDITSSFPEAEYSFIEVPGELLLTYSESEDTLETLLPNGTLNISYPDGEVDPLTVSLNVSWQEDENTRSIELVTLVTSQ